MNWQQYYQKNRSINLELQKTRTVWVATIKVEISVRSTYSGYRHECQKP